MSSIANRGPTECDVYVCTKQGGFGWHVRSFFNSDGVEVVVYRWRLGITTAYARDVRILPSRDEAAAYALAEEYWESLDRASR